MTSNNETRLHLVDALHFVGTTPSGHEIELDSNVSDEPPVAATPMEVQLVALGGCTAMDTISVLRKMRQDVTAYDVRLSAERAPAHPRVYTSIVMTHEVRGRGISDQNVHRAIQLTMTRYCPIFAMLYPKVHIIERYEITDEASGVVGSGDVSIRDGETGAAAH